MKTETEIRQLLARFDKYSLDRPIDDDQMAIIDGMMSALGWVLGDTESPVDFISSLEECAE